MGQTLITKHILWKSAAEFCNETLQELNNKNVFLFLDESLKKQLSLEKWYEGLSERNSLTYLDRIPSNPTYIDIFNALRQYGEAAPEVMLAIGGGSAIDMAKACTGLMYLKDKDNFDKQDVLQSLKSKEYLKHSVSIPIYAVPTTAGTGSEVTHWATIWDMEGKAKYSIDSVWLFPEKAYIVAEFTRTMPARLTLSTGLDALCQAIEAYWAKTSNPIIRTLAKSAIEIIVEYLPDVLDDLDNLHYREKMCLGSLFAGLAFANTRTTACHSISYPLTMSFAIEHGLACALSLAKIMEINWPVIAEPEELMKSLGVNNPVELQIWIDNLTSDIVKMRLSAFGIEEMHIDELAELSFTQGRMDNNPVEIMPDDVRRILIEIMF